MPVYTAILSGSLSDLFNGSVLLCEIILDVLTSPMICIHSSKKKRLVQIQNITAFYFLS